MDLNLLVSSIGSAMWGWPLLALFVGVGLLVSFALRFVQIRYMITCIRMVFSPSVGDVQSGKAELSPFQAFINSLAVNTGNGSIAGMATAVYVGGPGAVFWLLVAGLLGMALRFAEVYLGTCFTGTYTFKGAKGGPMVYLSLIPGGAYLPYIYAFLMCLYCFAAGNAMQVNNIGMGIAKICSEVGFSVSLYVIASLLTAFMAYAIFGGADRILSISDKLTPFKVILFFIATTIVLIFHASALLPALKLIFKEAMNPTAAAAGAAGACVQYAMKAGFARSLNAHESGLGLAAVLFGSTESKQPMRDSIMSMASTFICNYFVCFSVALLIVASGVWASGEQSLALTIAAYSTVFGSFGPWIVTFISASFGLGVLVACTFIGKQCFLFLTGNRFLNLYYALYLAITFFGTVARVDLVWNSIDIVNGLMLVINLFAIVWLLPRIAKDLRAYQSSSRV